MSSLFANETMEAVTPGFFPPYFWAMVLALVIVSVVVIVLAMVAWRMIDKITPGILDKELLGRDPAQQVIEPHKPNIALAIVVGCMFLGFSVVLGLVAHGVLTH